METVSIQTSQNIEIEHNLASVGERLIATLLDYCFLGSYFVIISVIATAIQTESIGFYVIVMLPIIFYHIALEIILGGQSLGKMILRIKVVKIDGSQTSIGSYIIRWIFRIVDVMLMTGLIGLITILINGKGQRLGDLAARTTVIKIDRKTSLKETIHISLPANYAVVFPQAIHLSESDIYTIKETLEFYQRNRFRHNAVITANKAKQAVEKKLGITSTMHPEQFFQTIIADFNYVNSTSE